MPTLSINWLNILSRRGESYPPILGDGNTVKWFDFMENILYDGSNFVYEWDNKSGITGIIPGALLQAVGTNQPLWTADGVLFDGLDNFMKCAAFTLIQPEMIYLVFKQITWTVNDRFFDGNASNTGGLRQSTATPTITAYAGASSPDNNNLALDTYGIVRVLFNGASSKLQINETVAGTGNFGASNMGGFILGSTDGLIRFAYAEFKEIIIRKIADTAPNEASIYSYLASKYSI